MEDNFLNSTKSEKNLTNAERSIELENLDQIRELFGKYDENTKIIEDAFNISIVLRGSEIKICGNQSDVEKVDKILKKLCALSSNGELITKQVVNYLVELAYHGKIDSIESFETDYIHINSRGKKIKPKTEGQNLYINAILKNDIVFGIGPAGTGKTFLAVVMAVNAYKNKQVGKIVITRPAVEAGEKLGFLPGDFQNKVDPYLRPLYDALFDTMGTEAYSKHIEKGVIEVVPLAYMRGRNLENSFIILDEAQNTTAEQMKMFLTRMGAGSKIIITGDITQIDLPKDKKSGLQDIKKILKGIEGIAFVNFTEMDVVRHELLKKIIKAYEKFEFDKEQ
jgi:phosphate starvation-inducible PhoH-like protein